MSKTLIKSLIVLAVAILVYSAFWFFRIGQVEKQVNNFINENSSYISAGEVSVSGFPVSQKIVIKDLKFTIPTPVLSGRQVVIKNFEAKAAIFSADFAVTITEGIALQDPENNIANVEFTKEPEIIISISNDKVTKLSYQDFGYRVFDAEKNQIYAASSSVFELKSGMDDKNQAITKITANIKDIENFDVLDVYKNSFEKKIIESIKTGEIAISQNNSSALIPPTTELQPANLAIAAQTETGPTKGESNVDSQKDNQSPPVEEANTELSTQEKDSGQNPQSQIVDSEADQKVKDVEAVLAGNDSIKSNFVMDIEYSSSSGQDQQLPVPGVDASNTIQENPTQHGKVVKVNNLEFSNSLYKIIINGEMASYQDDSSPSGSLSIKVENINNLIDYVTSGLNRIIEQKKKSAELEMQSTDLSENGLPTENSYQDFLIRIAASLNIVSKELAAKNAVSKDDVAVFDIRREKNLEFLINETSMREVLGKF